MIKLMISLNVRQSFTSSMMILIISFIAVQIT